MPKEFYVDAVNEHRFRVRSDNGEIVGHGEGYTRADDAKRGYEALLAAMEYDFIRCLLKTILTGWMLHEQSYDKDELDGYGRDETDCMTEAAGGNLRLGYLLHLFSHWSNDVQEIAAHYGLAFERVKPEDDGDFETAKILRIRDDLPPPPCPESYWENGAWIQPHGLQPGDEVVDGPSHPLTSG